MISLKRWISRSRSCFSDIPTVPTNARDPTLEPYAIMRSLPRSTKQSNVSLATCLIGAKSVQLIARLVWPGPGPSSVPMSWRIVATAKSTRASLPPPAPARNSCPSRGTTSCGGQVLAPCSRLPLRRQSVPRPRSRWPETGSAPGRLSTMTLRAYPGTSLSASWRVTTPATPPDG
jgi:hypothetical protein